MVAPGPNPLTFVVPGTAIIIKPCETSPLSACVLGEIVNQVLPVVGQSGHQTGLVGAADVVFDDEDAPVRFGRGHEPRQFLPGRRDAEFLHLAVHHLRGEGPHAG